MVFHHGSQSSTAIWTILCCLQLALAQVVTPSNGTLPVDPNSPQMVLNPRVGSMLPFDIDPLTMAAGLSNSVQQLDNIKIMGTLILTTPSNVNDLTIGQMAYISCDNHSYPGFATSQQTVQTAANKIQGPDCVNEGSCDGGAIILYSTTSTFCQYSPSPGFNYGTIFTVTNASASQTLLTALTAPGSPGAQTTIMLDQNSINNQNGTSNQQLLGPSPTTAVAMIILYSITGIITSLFLTIIITGAVRAHRHPERYGPRNIIGRSRQTRAKGIARAMLESLPIVKFGEHSEDTNKAAPSERDIELGQDRASGTEIAAASDAERGIQADGEHQSSESVPGPETVLTEEAQGITGGPAEDNAENGLACSVCTDDFVKGQNLRVLPCNHKFHPECIDPWLLNVSGTCPLCRVDLRPTASPTDEATGEGHGLSPNPYLAGQSEAASGHEPWLTTDMSGSNPEVNATDYRPRGNGLALYIHHTLNQRRMRNATPEERLEALRRIRTVNRANTSNETGERPRNGVSARLSRFLGSSSNNASEQGGTEQAISGPGDGVVR